MVAIWWQFQVERLAESFLYPVCHSGGLDARIHSEFGAQVALADPAAEGPCDLDDVAPGIPRHHKLLNSNEPPEGPEVAFIQSVSSKADARLAYLDHEISQLRDRLKRFDVVDSPWLLTHVSSRWRAVSISNLSFCSLVVIDYDTTNSPSSDRRSTYPLSMLQIQVQRAQKLKIHFYATEDAQLEIFEILARHSSRWEELSIEVTPTILPVLATLRNRLPLLRRLWIQWDSQRNPGLEDCPDFFRSAPSLIDVGVGEWLAHRPLWIPFPVHQLKRYELAGSMAMHLGALKLAKNLVEASVTAYIGQNEAVSETVDLLFLRRLYVLNPSILDYIRAPSLEEVSLYIGPGFLTHLQALGVRSACHLRRICLRGSLTARTTIELLGKIPSIFELRIILDEPEANEVNTLISNLIVPDSHTSARVAPQLRRVSIGSSNGGSIDHTLYLQMVKSRWEAADYVLTPHLLQGRVRARTLRLLLGYTRFTGKGWIFC
ncbi:hypothetical protein B0H17DRAFT_1230242 [Mycena rosella]|uniref:F-box domain-containing protein n=1 Tax=Mycena rosella TaxID=1033263 RepID=A0AAD7GEH7_MYCRO|nr:hypothetical protein B0H17DRAFT_1230242 [Mycena rosella]